MFGARFDDGEAGRSFELAGPVSEVVAWTQSDVPGAIRKAGEAAAEGKWVAGYVSYEAAPGIDDSLVVQTPGPGPLVWFGVFEDRVELDPPELDPMASGAFSVSRWVPAWEQDRYDKAFGVVRDAIERGETYQVNLTFPLTAAFSGSADLMYESLVESQRPPYAAHVWHGETHVLSVSPERFFSISGNRIVTKPMKGTSRRGRWYEEDEQRRDDLLHSAKDRSENLMIVDLLRNDLGRIAEFGSVVVNEAFSIEKYPTVWQMTSEISARLRYDTDLGDVFGALFPCGSVTGAPKGSAMQVIADLEPGPRGVYCGAIGFVPPGDGIDGANFNVAIRTAVIDEKEGLATYGVGGGVTWDSSSEGEYDEALAKSRALRGGSQVVDLVESIRWDGDYVFLEEHLSRLSTSAKYWGMPCDVDSLRPLLADVAESLDAPTKVRVLALGEGNVSVSISSAPRRFADAPGPVRDPLHVSIDLEPLDRNDPHLYHKVADRSQFDARRRRHGDADDVLCVNEEGRVTEFTIANAAFLIDGTWVTPPVTDGLLPGILRQARVEDGTLSERSVTVAEALEAEAAALLNSVRGWLPAIIDHPI